MDFKTLKVLCAVFSLCLLCWIVFCLFSSSRYVCLCCLCYIQFLVCVLFYARCGPFGPAAGAPRPLHARSVLTRTTPRFARCGPFGPAAGASRPSHAGTNDGNASRTLKLLVRPRKNVKIIFHSWPLKISKKRNQSMLQR